METAIPVPTLRSLASKPGAFGNRSSGHGCGVSARSWSSAKHRGGADCSGPSNLPRLSTGNALVCFSRASGSGQRKNADQHAKDRDGQTNDAGDRQQLLLVTLGIVCREHCDIGPAFGLHGFHAFLQDGELPCKVVD